MSSNLISLRSQHGDGDDEGEFDSREGYIEVRVEGGMRCLLWAQHIEGIKETEGGGCLVVYNNDPVMVKTSYDDVKKLLSEFFYVAAIKVKR